MEKENKKNYWCEKYVEKYINIILSLYREVLKENKKLRLFNNILITLVLVFIISYSFFNISTITEFLYTFLYANNNENLTEFARNYTQGTYGIFAANKLSYWINKNIEYYHNGNMKASEVFELRKGVCKDNSILLISFMRNLGIFGVLQSSSNKNHAIAKFYDNLGYFYCDPTLGNPFSEYCRSSLDCSRGVCNDLTNRCETENSLSFCWRPY